MGGGGRGAGGSGGGGGGDDQKESWKTNIYKKTVIHPQGIDPLVE